MKMPQTIGLVHFIGIGGIGMSGIAEVLHNLGYRVQGSDQADSANVQRLRDKGIECFVGHRAENLGDAEVVVVSTAIKKSNPELKAARERAAADRAARRDAGRADALPPGDRHRRHARQDHHDLAGRHAARSRRPRPDRGQWRHHQRLRHQCAHGRRRVDGGRGRRERRHLPEAAGRHRRGHQHRSRASRPLRHLRQGEGGVPAVRRERAVLRLRRHVHRPSGSAGAGLAHRGPPRDHLWRQRAGRRALHAPSHGRRGVDLRRGDPRPQDRHRDDDRQAAPADARPPQRLQCDRGDRRRA